MEYAHMGRASRFQINAGGSLTRITTATVMLSLSYGVLLPCTAQVHTHASTWVLVLHQYHMQSEWYYTRACNSHFVRPDSCWGTRQHSSWGHCARAIKVQATGSMTGYVLQLCVKAT